MNEQEVCVKCIICAMGALLDTLQLLMSGATLDEEGLERFNGALRDAEAAIESARAILQDA